MSFIDCSVLQLLSLHSCLLLSLEIDVNLVQREKEEEGYLLRFFRGVKNRCLTSTQALFKLILIYQQPPHLHVNLVIHT